MLVIERAIHDGICRLADLNAGRREGRRARRKVTDAAAVEALVAQIVERFGRLDVLVNNAGIGEVAAAARDHEASWDRTLAVDLKGPFLCLQAAARRMREGGDSIVNISFQPLGLPVPEARRGGRGRALSRFRPVVVRERLDLLRRHYTGGFALEEVTM
jgi:NAD(P)-dependent dehydrogenase (short-subunit alcohol dehydrogenase family)